MTSHQSDQSTKMTRSESHNSSDEKASAPHYCHLQTKTSNELKHTHLVSFDDVFQFSQEFGLNFRAQVDDRSRQAVVLL